MELSYKKRLMAVLVGIIVLSAGGLLVKRLLLPKSFGVYGPYRADAIVEAAITHLRPVALAAATPVLGVIPLLQDVF